MEESEAERYSTEMQPHQFAGSMVGFLTASGKAETPATAISAEVDIVFRASGSQLRISGQAGEGGVLLELSGPLASHLLRKLLDASFLSDDAQE